jgi:hypothetical protein
MSDDRLQAGNDLEVFEAIVSNLRDPEVAQFGRMFLLLGITVYIAAIVALTTAGGFGWHGAFGFSATFVPGMYFAWRHQRRRLGLPAATR